MPKISSTENKTVIIKFVLRCLITSIISVLLLSLLFSAIVLKFDIDLEILKILTYIIVSVSAFITSSVSLIKIKHNFILISIISALPLILFVMINGIVNTKSIADILVKIILIVLFSFLSAIIKSVKKG